MAQVTQLFDQEEIASRVNALAASIASTIEGNFMIVGLLKGSFIFLADLVRALDDAGCTPQVEFMRVSSYGDSKESSGQVRISCDLEKSPSGCQVLLVDDIVDSGRSLLFSKIHLENLGVTRVWTCALLDKRSRRAVDCEADFVGFSINDGFIVGYGIDYAEKYRHLPYIGCVD